MALTCTLALAGCHLIFPFNVEPPPADAAPLDLVQDAPPELDGAADAPPESDGGSTVPAPEVLWASQSTGASSHQCLAQDVVADAAGNTYVVGRFSGTVDFGSTKLTNVGGAKGTDAFMAGYDANGTNLWASRLDSAGGADLDGATGVTLAPNGDVLVTGFVSGGVSFGTTKLPTYGDKDAFVARLSTGGTLKWIARIGGVGEDKGLDVVVTGAGKVHVVGSSTGSIVATTKTGTKNATGFGDSDCFMATLDTSGNTTELVVFGGSGPDRFGAAAVDSNGALLVAGEYTGQLVIGSGKTNIYGDRDLLVARYKATSPSLVVSMGGVGTDRANGLALAALNTIYLAGSLSGEANLGSGTMGQVGKNNGYLVKRQSNGMNGWARVTETDKNAVFQSLALDSKGRPCVTGSFRSAVTLAGNTRSAMGLMDILVAGYGTGGDLHWMESYGGAEIDVGWGVAADDKGHVYVTGQFQQSVAFGTQPPLTAVGGGSADMFLIKLKPPASGAP
jgi:hypothetical protein